MMRFLNSLSISKKLSGSLMLISIGFLLFGWYSFQKLNQLKVKGPIYNEIVRGKDLIADVLPPPDYIIESYLTAFELRENIHDPAAVSRVVEEVNTISQTIVSAVEQQSATVNEIARNVAGVSIGAQEVSNNVAESAKGLTEVAKTIGGVSNAVSDTARGVSQVKSSADKLAKLSENLKNLLKQFKV